MPTIQENEKEWPKKRTAENSQKYYSLGQIAVNISKTEKKKTFHSYR